MLEIGGIKLNSPFVLAPLAGISDVSFRTICAETGAALTCSEMISAKGLTYRDRNTLELLEIGEGEGPVALQLFGSEPDVMAEAAEFIKDRRNVFVDINMGCPVPKVVRNGEGSALMKDPEKAGEIVAAVSARAGKPVTVKIRAGWDSRAVNAVRVAESLEAAGAAAVAAHGRTREQFYSGSADWNIIRDVKKAVSVPVAGNGDVFSAEDAVRMLDKTGCDFVMIARGALGNPWIFREALALREGRPYERPLRDERLAMMDRHFTGLLALKGEYAAVRQMRKHVGWYVKGMKGAAELRRRVCEITKADEMFSEFEKYKRHY